MLLIWFIWVSETPLNYDLSPRFYSLSSSILFKSSLISKLAEPLLFETLRFVFADKVSLSKALSSSNCWFFSMIKLSLLFTISWDDPVFFSCSYWSSRRLYLFYLVPSSSSSLLTLLLHSLSYMRSFCSSCLVILEISLFLSFSRISYYIWTFLRLISMLENFYFSNLIRSSNLFLSSPCFINSWFFAIISESNLEMFSVCCLLISFSLSIYLLRD